MNLSERLRHLRDKHGWTLAQQREGIKRETGEAFAISYLSSLERDADRSPGIIALVRIARGYGMCVQELLAPVSFDGDVIADQAEATSRLASGNRLRVADGAVLDRNGYPDDDWVYGTGSDSDAAEIASVLAGVNGHD